MYGHLSLQQAPPLSVPARFFLTAPVFGALAALILMQQGHTVLLSRWTPGMLALTHCLVLGFFASIMIGALQQLLPVVAGAIIKRPRLTAAIVYTQWIPGILFLVLALLYVKPALFLAAIVLLSGAVISFIVSVIISFIPVKSAGESVPGIKLALSSLLITLILGILLALGWAGAGPLQRPLVTDLHLSWGLLGWIAMLIMVIAWQVVPMFQIAPPYPKPLRRFTVPVALVLLLLKSLLAWQPGLPAAASISTGVDTAIALGLLIFAGVTLNLQRQARRKVRDSHRDFWRLAMINLILAVALWSIATATGRPLFHLLAATVFIMGFALAVVTGMLLKIVAFLIWLHLTAASDGLRTEGHRGYSVPRMKTIISEWSSERLLYLLILAETATIAALGFPAYFSIAAALLWLVQFCYLEVVLGKALLRYRSIMQSIAREQRARQKARIKHNDR